MSECIISNDWTFRGIETIILENHNLRIVVLAGKGTDISEITYKPLDLNLLYRNPWGPRSPRFFPPISPHAEMFRDYTGGGWSDIIPNAGAPSTVMGAVLGLHDETPLLKWSSEISENTSSLVSAEFQVKLNKFPLTIQKSMSLDNHDVLRIVESVTNESAQDIPFSWLIHPTFAKTFASPPDSRIELDAQNIYDVRNESIKESQFPFFEELDGTVRDIRVIPDADLAINKTLVMGNLNDGKYSITNAQLGLKFTLSWPKEIFKYVWYYRSLKSQDYPYYGRSSFIALEPCTSLRSGLNSQLGANDVIVLSSGKSVEVEISATIKRE